MLQAYNIFYMWSFFHEEILRSSIYTLEALRQCNRLKLNRVINYGVNKMFIKRKFLSILPYDALFCSFSYLIYTIYLTRDVIFVSLQYAFILHRSVRINVVSLYTYVWVWRNFITTEFIRYPLKWPIEIRSQFFLSVI